MGVLPPNGVFVMNAKLMTAAVLALVVVGGGLALFGAADDSDASIDDGNTYPVEHDGQVNMSDLFLVLGVIILIAAAFCVGLAIYVKLYGDF